MARLARALVVSAVFAVLVNTAGCPLGCGVAPVDDSGHVKDGVVTFDPTLVGQSEQLQITFNDDVGAAETIQGATITGADASSFSVQSAFPIELAEGATVQIAIRFSPGAAGTRNATLTLQTMNMGPSPVALTGVGRSQ